MAETATRVLLEGISFPESPRWHDGRLWFSDWMAHRVIALDESGESEVIAEVEAFPFSIDWLPEGPMLVTAGRELLQLTPDGTLATRVDLGEVTEYGLNEIVIDGRGYAYVNGPGFDLMAGEEPRPGMIAVVTPDNEVRQVAGDIAFPNGMAITADGSTLLVADSYGRELTAFDVGGDGSLSNRRVWADLGEGTPDGICIDAEGAAWYADVPNGRCVRVAEGGEVLQTIDLDRGCFACMLGGSDGMTLFIAAQEWGGPEKVGMGPPTGRIVTAEAPAPRAGYP